MTLRPNYIVEPFKKEYLEIYYRCLNDTRWFSLFGLEKATFDLAQYISSAVLTDYPSVERVLVKNKASEFIFFAHLCCENGSCFVSGGIVPELISSGKGVCCALAVLAYVFKTKDCQSINVTVLNSNSISFKMIKKFGFYNKNSTAKDRLKGTDQLDRYSYPNDFCKKLLTKMKYEG